MLIKSLLLLAVASVASAHFQILYPAWRADSLSNSNYSQYMYPCAGVPSGAWSDNRTDWPATGGSLSIDLHHPWTYIFINFGLGDNVTDFNYTLTTQPWNETGSGTLCIPHIDLPTGLNVTDGQHASIQISTVGPEGTALYNCADIALRTTNIANYGGGTCNNTAGVSYSVVNQEVNGTTSTNGNSSSSTTGSGAATTTTGKNSGVALGANTAVLATVVALTVAFVAGMCA